METQKDTRKFVVTNKISVEWNEEKFFQEYSIIEYNAVGPERNIPYERLSNIPCLSVAGLETTPASGKREITFFVLVKYDKGEDVRHKLQETPNIRAQYFSTKKYSTETNSRIIASLAINSLGMVIKGRNMYNDGRLFVTCDTGFVMEKKPHKKEFVCLQIEVTKDLNILVSTATFSQPSTLDELKKHRSCVFQFAKDFDGKHIEGKAVKRVIVDDRIKAGDYNLKELWFHHKPKGVTTKNLVVWWPHNIEKVTHGKLFTLWDVVEKCNETFRGLIKIEFKSNEIIYSDAYRTEKEMTSFVQKTLDGCSVYIEGIEGNDTSKVINKEFPLVAQALMGSCSLDFVQQKEGNCLTIKLCPSPSDNESYLKGDKRERHGEAIQHLVCDEDMWTNHKNDIVRRILIELVAKKCLEEKRVPHEISNELFGWKFCQYKLNNGLHHGCILDVDKEGCMNVKEIGLGDKIRMEDYKTFVKQYLHYNDFQKLSDSKDYMVLEKSGNVFLIVDTEEVPILPLEEIELLYQRIERGEEEIKRGGIVGKLKVSMVKRVAEREKFFRGYSGISVWKINNIDGEKDCAYAYIPGLNVENRIIGDNTVTDRMPRVRQLFILHKEHSEHVEAHVLEIIDMLEFGFGRWKEVQAYPFPFKFTKEYLDKRCEILYGFHWNEFPYRKSLKMYEGI